MSWKEIQRINAIGPNGRVEVEGPAGHVTIVGSHEAVEAAVAKLVAVLDESPLSVGGYYVLGRYVEDGQERTLSGHLTATEGIQTWEDVQRIQMLLSQEKGCPVVLTDWRPMAKAALTVEGPQSRAVGRG